MIIFYICIPHFLFRSIELLEQEKSYNSKVKIQAKKKNTRKTTNNTKAKPKKEQITSHNSSKKVPYKRFYKRSPRPLRGNDQNLPPYI